MTPTELRLLALHRAPVIRLSEICERYLDIAIGHARRRASLHDLPFPTFQLEPENSKSPWMVRVEDLAEFLDEVTLRGLAAWNKSNP